MEPIKRNVLLNPGPATTTDTVKYAQVVPDICPREKEFAGLMKGLRSDLCKVAHAPEPKFTSVLFCGSGTINIDVCINSLVPEGKKILVVGHSTALAVLFSKWCEVSYDNPYTYNGSIFFDGKWNYCETFKVEFDNTELKSIKNIR